MHAALLHALRTRSRLRCSSLRLNDDISKGAGQESSRRGACSVRGSTQTKSPGAHQRMRRITVVLGFVERDQEWQLSLFRNPRICQRIKCSAMRQGPALRSWSALWAPPDFSGSRVAFQMSSSISTSRRAHPASTPPDDRRSRKVHRVSDLYGGVQAREARGRHTACARPFLIFPRGVSKGWSRLESCTPGERTESQQVTARS
jgi:hypothetical protein